MRRCPVCRLSQLTHPVYVKRVAPLGPRSIYRRAAPYLFME